MSQGFLLLLRFPTRGRISAFYSRDSQRADTLDRDSPTGGMPSPRLAKASLPNRVEPGPLSLRRCP